VTAETDVNPQALINWAQVWDQQSAVFGSIATEANGTMPSGAGAELGVAGSAAGAFALGDYLLFKSCLDAYEQVCPQLAALAGQASQQMSAIADGLLTAVRSYASNERTIIMISENALQEETP
jgi:hypothetical protein